MNPTLQSVRTPKRSASIARIALCGIPVDTYDRESMLQRMIELSAEHHRHHHVCYVNAHVHNLAVRDRTLRRVLRGAEICYADGASIVWAARRKGVALPSRMTAADFFPDYVRRFTQQGRRLFLLGGRPGVAEAAALALQRQISDFHPAGTNHGYLDQAESEQVIAQVNRSRADVLVVGMGSPAQEYWIERYRNRLDVPLVWAVGALLDYSAGIEKRCPRWMGERGLEWLYRLAQQPRKMASRYLIGNPKFVWRILRHQRLERRNRRRPIHRRRRPRPR